MNSLPFELFVGWRYTRAKRKNHFTSFISITSMVGIALGVAVLIIVLSVMNGFGTELRNRILGVASHMQVMGINSPLSDWQNVVAQAKTVPQVKAAAPYVMGQGMLSFGQYAQGAIVRGIVPAQEVQVAELGNKMKVGQLDNLRAGEFGIVLGIDLARYLGAELGDKVMLMTPNGQATPAGMVPRMKQFKLVGVFEMDMKEYDGNLALVHIEDAAKLYRMGDDVSGVRLKLDDLLISPFIPNTHAVFF